jgi:glutamate synthase domain-containing protein 1/glutamate synthase domain-containing protein 3
MACAERIPGRAMLTALAQMRNRGNGKGGGIAAAGLDPAVIGVSRDILDSHFLVSIAYLDPSVRSGLEQRFIHPPFEVSAVREQPHISDYRALRGMEILPPEVTHYFVRVRPAVVEAFGNRNGLTDLPRDKIEEEVVYQNSYALNTVYYASAGEKKAFVLSHGRNLLVLKMVGYGDDVVRYYRLEDVRANVWIGHHRYPTKGRVWHPGGAHPFVGLNEALVHNGDFANYAAIVEYLAQRHIHPLFLTDTEVSVLVFDLLHRIYGYPLEYVIEALAPTTERDFTLLPAEKKEIYRALQTVHIHASPDGPWFFLIAQSLPPQNGEGPAYRLLGITDTSMLRPQVFALQEGEVPIGFAASEKQAIDAALASLADEDARFYRSADLYWNARGGSHTDGGAFGFTVRPHEDGHASLICSDKFGQTVCARPIASRASAPPSADDTPAPRTAIIAPSQERSAQRRDSAATFPDARPLFESSKWFDFPVVKEELKGWSADDLRYYLTQVTMSAQDFKQRENARAILTRLLDRRYSTGGLSVGFVRSEVSRALDIVFERVRRSPGDACRHHAFGDALREPVDAEQTVVVDARGFAPEGSQSLSRELVALYRAGWSHFIVVHTRGHRFIGNGFGAHSHRVRLEIYGSPGDYLGSGIDGMEIIVHASGQDQLAQIMKAGKLVVHGDVGQAFMYAAKGGSAFVLGNVAGRPLINAVGRPRVVINGTALDYLAESFMAGDPYQGGGFVVINGLRFDAASGDWVDLDSPYPGGNLFSLASGGALFVRDPHRAYTEDPRKTLTEDQLNGGEFTQFTPRDWDLVEEFLRENERLFGIPVRRLLTVDGYERAPEEVYVTVRPRAVRALQAEEAWIHKHA